jgi:hypothetical protein
MWSKIRTLIKNNLTGILGTIAFHLIIAVVFMMIRFSATKSDLESVIYLDLGEEPVREELTEPVVNEDPRIEQMVNELLAESRRNIPVNLSSQINEEISTDKYLEQLAEDMNGTRPDAYYRQLERLQELSEPEEIADMYMEPEKSDNQVKVYKGLTTIYYSLENRYHTELPIPVYKCEGAGEITVTIAVDQRGRVVQVEFNSEAVSTNEYCLEEAARNAALATRFNIDMNAPVRQKGTITYHFIAQ